MPKRTSRAKPDAIQNARRVVDESVSEGQAVELTPAAISKVMAEMGRKGGLIGGKRKLETLSPKRRSQIASKAAKARWAKTKKPKKK